MERAPKRNARRSVRGIDASVYPFSNVLHTKELVRMIVGRNLSAFGFPRLGGGGDDTAAIAMDEESLWDVVQLRTTSKRWASFLSELPAILRAAKVLGKGQFADAIFSGILPRARCSERRLTALYQPLVVHAPAEQRRLARQGITLIKKTPECPVCKTPLSATGWYGDHIQLDTVAAFQALCDQIDSGHLDQGLGTDEQIQFLQTPAALAPGALLRAPFRRDTLIHFGLDAVLCDRVRDDNADEDDAPCNDHPTECLSLLPGANLTCAKGCFSLQIVQCTSCEQWSADMCSTSCNYKYCDNSGGNDAERSELPPGRKCKSCFGGESCDSCGRFGCACRFVACVHEGCDATMCKFVSFDAYNAEDEQDGTPIPDCALVDYSSQPNYDDNESDNDDFYHWSAFDHAFCKRHAPVGSRTPEYWG